MTNEAISDINNLWPPVVVLIRCRELVQKIDLRVDIHIFCCQQSCLCGGCWGHDDEIFETNIANLEIGMFMQWKLVE